MTSAKWGGSPPASSQRKSTATGLVVLTWPLSSLLTNLSGRSASTPSSKRPNSEGEAPILFLIARIESGAKTVSFILAPPICSF